MLWIKVDDFHWRTDDSDVECFTLPISDLWPAFCSERSSPLLILALGHAAWLVPAGLHDEGSDIWVKGYIWTASKLALGSHWRWRSSNWGQT